MMETLKNGAHRLACTAKTGHSPRLSTGLTATRQQHWLKNDFIFTHGDSEVIYFVSLCQDSLETEYGRQRNIQNFNFNNLISVMVHVLHQTQNLVISKCTKN